MESTYKVSMEEVEIFLHGRDPEKYITAIEYDGKTNTIYKFKDDPEKGHYIEEDYNFKAFCWGKNLRAVDNSFYRYQSDPANVNPRVIQERIRTAMTKYGITYTKLIDDGNERLLNGYNYLFTSSKGYYSLIEFFRNGKLNVFDKDNFIILPVFEQYLIQSGKRLFKGMENYEDVHRLVFDLETQGLYPRIHKIFSIGIYDNRGFELILEAPTTDPTPEEETNLILDLFTVIDNLKPSIVGAYNGFDFDWSFMLERSTQLGLDFNSAVIPYLPDKQSLKLKSSGVKIGGDIENFTQFHMWGYNTIDINHATKKAQAIDSDMKNTKLKYVCKYNKIEKKNRVYIQGNKIFNLWGDSTQYYYNDTDGNYLTTRPAIIRQKFISRADVQANPEKIYIFGDNDQRKGLGGQAEEMRGEPNAIGIRVKKEPKKEETTSFYTDDEYKENIVKINEDINKIRTEAILKGKTIIIPEDGIGTGLSALEAHAPKTYNFLVRVLEYVEDYINNFQPVDGRFIVRRYLRDDIWETMEVDNIYNQASFLQCKLIPTIFEKAVIMGQSVGWKLLMLEWSYYQELAVPSKAVVRDFVGGLSRMMGIGFFKKVVKFDYKSLYPAEQLVFDMFPDVDITGIMKSFLKYFHSERFKAKALSKQYRKTDPQLSTKYSRKQLPLKIFINSDFGSISSPPQFPWADIDIGERITCTARQFLRLCMRFFVERGYTPLMNDTDGVNFALPEEGVDHITYIGQGIHENVEKGKEYRGIYAHTAEFNDKYLYAEMELDIEGTWDSQISASRKNYILLDDKGTIKLTGNSFKSRVMPTYISDFLAASLPVLTSGNGFGFVQMYNEYLKKAYNQEIPLVKIASKSKVKHSVADYMNRGLNKNGQALPKQAHMELIMQNDLNVNISDIIYYVNNGTAISHGDVKEKFKRDEKGKLLKDDDGNKIPDGIYSYVIPTDTIENNPDLLGEYNIPKVIDSLNKKLLPLMVVFHPDVRKKILLKNPEDMVLFTPTELELCNNMPDHPDDKDDLSDFFAIDPRETKFWEKFNYNPNIWENENLEFYVPGYKKHGE